MPELLDRPTSDTDSAYAWRTSALRAALFDYAFPTNGRPTTAATITTTSDLTDVMTSIADTTVSAFTAPVREYVLEIGRPTWAPARAFDYASIVPFSTSWATGQSWLIPDRAHTLRLE